MRCLRGLRVGARKFVATGMGWGVGCVKIQANPNPRCHPGRKHCGVANSLDTHMTEEQLDEQLTRPGGALVEAASRWSGPLVVLGAGGKMGPTLSVLARRAAEAAGRRVRVIAVSRFGGPQARQWIESRGVETVACDLFDRSAVAGLPEAPDVLYLVGQKFGTQRDPVPTWGANVVPPGHVLERYPESRIVALSTGNVYPLVPVDRGGATEDTPMGPEGEYPNAAVARERIFEFHGRRRGTRMVFVRLNYAIDLRYGVLHDLARRVWQGEEIPLSNGWFNCIWQGDANDRILRLLEQATHPPSVYNLTGPVVSVRECATRLGRLLDRPVRLAGTESPTALLSSAGRLNGLYGAPPTALDDMLAWTAEWVRAGGRTLDKPTGFEVRDGRF